MTAHELVSKPEFWAALFGALAAFLLGVLGTWWSATKTKQTTGNLTLIALSQMFALLENLRHHLLVSEPARFRAISGRAPRSFELRKLTGLPNRVTRIPFDQLGFLADSHDPDVLNRLIIAERAFDSLLESTRRLGELQAEFMEKLNRFDPSGQRALQPSEILAVGGTKLLIEIDDFVEALRTGLPEGRDSMLAVGNQLRQTLRMQFPSRRFLGFSPIPRSSLIELPSGLPSPVLWRRIVRRVVDEVRTRMGWGTKQPPASAVPPFPEALEIKRFPPRSYGGPP